LRSITVGVDRAVVLGTQLPDAHLL